MYRKKWFWIVAAVLLLVVGGVVAYTSGWAGKAIPALARDAGAEPETVLETATVTVGDPRVTRPKLYSQYSLPVLASRLWRLAELSHTYSRPLASAGDA